jgi:hypothetical protein
MGCVLGMLESVTLSIVLPLALRSFMYFQRYLSRFLDNGKALILRACITLAIAA